MIFTRRAADPCWSDPVDCDLLRASKIYENTNHERPPRSPPCHMSFSFQSMSATPKKTERLFDSQTNL